VQALERAIREELSVARQDWWHASAGIVRYDFRRRVRLKGAALEERATRLDMVFRRCLAGWRNQLDQVESILKERSPLTLLQRGYSITRDAAGKIVREAGQVNVGDYVSVRLSRGELGAIVRDKKM
ncbi:MAG: exodeoxyribonuclease VII large subunit, partial [Gammaproteobacteria bacterium]